MAEQTLGELEQLVAEERDAIRRLDGSTVLDLAQRKQRLVEELCRAREGMRPEAVLRLQALVPELRQNGILLAHARNVLRDAVAVMRRAGSPTALPLPESPVGATISVRG